MQDIAKNIYDYSKTNKIINGKFIYNLVLKLVNLLELEEYIKTIVICDLNSNTLIRYLIDEKKLCIDVKKTICCVDNYVNKNINKSYEDKILLINLYILKILYHEIEHAIQEKKINNFSTCETKILILSHGWENKLKRSNLNFYENYKYLYNPIERQANMMSSRKIIKICNILNCKEILSFFYNEFLNQSLHGYKKSDYDYPILNFFSDNLDFLIISDQVKQDSIFNFSERLDMGLEISDDEYCSLKEKMKEEGVSLKIKMTLL